MTAWRRLAFLDPGPVDLDPVVDGGLVTFGRAAAGTLHTPAESMVQDRPEMGGWWRNPVSRSITSAMRSKVHSWPANPLATAPCSSAVSIVLSWPSDSRGVGPDGPWLRSASGPPAFQAACQLLTA
jgi:hypothetical protein